MTKKYLTAAVAVLALSGCATNSGSGGGTTAGDVVGGILGGTQKIIGDAMCATMAAGPAKQKCYNDVEGARQQTVSSFQSDADRGYASYRRGEGLSSDESQVKAYGDRHSSRKESYTIQGALGGAALGALAGCAVADKCAKGAIVGGIGGAVVGGVAGNYIAEEQNQAETEEAKLNATLTGAEKELAEARKARLSAQRAVARESAALRRARANLKAKRIQKAEYDRAYGRAAALAESIAYSREGAKSSADLIDKQINQGDASPAQVAKLKTQRDALRAEAARLDQSLDQLAAAMGESGQL